MSSLADRALALANDKRVEILSTLAKFVEPLTVARLAEFVGIRPSVCSKHLEILDRARLVEKIPSGRYTYVELSREGVKSLSQEVLGLLSVKDQEDEVWG